MAVPLLQEVDGKGAVLEGFLFLSGKLTRKPYRKGDIEYLDILAKMFAICLRNENLYRRSIVDTLTGVSSRGHFDAQLSQEIQRINASGQKGMCLLMLDVDHFKTFNDRYGHQTGDLVLQSLAKVLVEHVRNVDLVARYGGEEFAIILLEVDKAVALEVAQRLLNAVREMQIEAAGQILTITASVGLACFPQDAGSVHELVHAADTALYRSKDAGRNCITVAK
jgi:diguanylate cyclase (GGDEF)-like protein